MKTLFIRIGLFVFLVMVCVSIQPNTSVIATQAPAQNPPLPLLWYRPQYSTNSSPERIRSVVYDPATIGLALASEGNGGGLIFRSTDSGRTWNTLPNAPSDPRFTYALAYSSTATFLAYGQGGSLYKTTDSGDSWTPLALPILCNSIITLVVHPLETSTIYGSTPYGFLRSLDGGQTWQTFGEIGCGSPIATGFGIGIDEPNVVYAGQSYDRDGGGVQRSDNRGETWLPVSTGLPFSGGIPQNHVTVKQLLVDPRDADIVLARTEAGLIYKTVNGGGEWTSFIEGLDNVAVGSLYYDTKHSYRVYATTDYALYYLDDGATSWVQYPTLPLPQYASSPLTWNITADPFDEYTFMLYGDLGMVHSSIITSQVYVPLLTLGY